MKHRRDNRNRRGERGEPARESPGERVSRAFAEGFERGRPTGRERLGHTPRAQNQRPDDARDRQHNDARDRSHGDARSRRPPSSDAPRPFAQARRDGDEDTHVFGVQPVLEALRARQRPVERLTLAEGAHESRLHEILQLAKAAGVPVRRSHRAELQRLVGGANHQGVVATIAAAHYAREDELLDALAARVGTDEPPLAVVLDGVEDPRNLGAIIRTVECAGAHGVFVPERRAAGLTHTVAKAAAGALEYVPVARAANVARLVEELKGRGVWTVGTAADAETVYTEWDWAQPCALLLGGEGEGLRRLVRERCDVLVKIPLGGRIESLNVSVAAGIILFEALRQRTARRDDAYNGRQATSDEEEP